MDKKGSRLSVTFVSEDDVVEHILEKDVGGMAESENESCIDEVSENSRIFKITQLKMEPPDPLTNDQVAVIPPDPLSHDQLPYNCVALDIKQETVDMNRGPPEVDSCLDTTSEGSLDGEVDLLQEVAMESGDEQRDLVKMEIKLETEDGIVNEGGSEHRNGESSFLLNSSPSLASREIKSTLPKLKTPKIVLQKLCIKKKLVRCEDCHKVLQGSLDSTGQNITMKCDKCKTNQTLEAELHDQDMDTGADIAKEKINHPTPHGTSRICPNVKSKNSENDGYSGNGLEFTSVNLGGVLEKHVLQETETENDGYPGSGLEFTSVNLGEVLEKHVLDMSKTDDHSDLLRIKDATVLLDHKDKKSGKGANKRKRMDTQNDPTQEETKEKKKKEAVEAKKEGKMAQVLTGNGYNTISAEVHRTEAGEGKGQYTKAYGQDKDGGAGGGYDDPGQEEKKEKKKKKAVKVKKKEKMAQVLTGTGYNTISAEVHRTETGEGKGQYTKVYRQDKDGGAGGGDDGVFVDANDYGDDDCGDDVGDGVGDDDGDDVDLDGVGDDDDVDVDVDGADDHDGDVQVDGGGDDGSDDDGGYDDGDGVEEGKKKKKITAENLYHLLCTIDRKVDNLFNLVSLLIQKKVNKTQTSQTPTPNITGHQQLDDETLLLLKARSFSKGNFAKRLMTSLVSDEVLKVSNCSGMQPKNSKRGVVKKIPSEIMSYVFHTTYRLYGIADKDQSKCFREIVRAIDMYCRHLAASSANIQKAKVDHNM